MITTIYLISQSLDLDVVVFDGISLLLLYCSGMLACEKLLPYAVGAVLVFAILFGLYVRSLPPKVVGTPPKIPKTTTHTVPNTGGGGIPEFMRINTEPKPKPNNNGGDTEPAALDEAM